MVQHKQLFEKLHEQDNKAVIVIFIVIVSIMLATEFGLLSAQNYLFEFQFR